MNSAARRLYILNKLREERAVDISAITRECKVSIVTIRRDFKFMADQGLITVTHGGAILNEGMAVERGYVVHKERMTNEKRRIGAAIAKVLETATAVFLDCGSTVKCVAESMTTNQHTTVFSNSLLVANVITQFPNMKFIMVPGRFRNKSMGFVGGSAINFISGLNFDCAVVGVEGVDLALGATTPDFEDGICKQAVVRAANQVILAVDHTKIGKKTLVSVAPMKGIHSIVTGKEMDPELAKQIRAAGVNTILV